MRRHTARIRARRRHRGGSRGARLAAGAARYLTDPAIQAHIAAFVASAPAMTEDQCRKLARLLRTNRCATEQPSTVDRRVTRGRREKAA